MDTQLNYIKAYQKSDCFDEYIDFLEQEKTEQLSEMQKEEALMFYNDLNYNYSN